MNDAVRQFILGSDLFKGQFRIACDET